MLPSMLTFGSTQLDTLFGWRSAMAIDYDSVLIYGTRIPSDSADINQDLKEMVNYARIALVKTSNIVLPQIFDHILCDYMLPVPAGTTSSLRKLPKVKRKRSKSYNGDTDDTEHNTDSDEEEQEEEEYDTMCEWDRFETLEEQINDTIVCLFGPKEQTVQLSYARPYYDCGRNDFSLYFTYSLPRTVTLQTIQSIDTTNYKSICALFNVQCHSDGPELLSLPNIW